MKKVELMTALDSFIQEAKIYLNENDIPEARDALNNIIKIADGMNNSDQAANKDGDNQNRADQGEEQSSMDAAAADCDGG